VQIDPVCQTNTTQQGNFKKKIAEDSPITYFDRQAAIFNGASMEAITLGFSEVQQLNSPVRMAR
jgi:hypothetical protein